MSKKEEKITIKKKMSNRDFISLAYYLEDKEIPDFEGKDATYLAKVETRYMRVTREGKEKIDKFLNRFILGVSADALFDEIPCVKKPYVPPTQQVVVQAPVQQAPVLNNPPANNPVVEQQAPVETENPAMIISEDERWEWAKADRTPNYDVDVWSEQDVKNFPFIKDFNKPVAPDNIDIEMMLYMLEHGKMAACEVIAMFNSNGANKMIDFKADNLKLRSRYKNEVNVYGVLVEAEHIGYKYLAMMKEPEPSEDEVLDRYKLYVKHNTPSKNERLDEIINDMDVITNISNNKIEFETDDGDELEKDYLEYETAEDMLIDLLYLSYYSKFGNQIDFTKKYDIFNKRVSLKNFISDIYKKFPHGFTEDKKFYRTRKEAYDDGALQF